MCHSVTHTAHIDACDSGFVSSVITSQLQQVLCLLSVLLDDLSGILEMTYHITSGQALKGYDIVPQTDGLCAGKGHEIGATLHSLKAMAGAFIVVLILS
jgi:hypothetical protein